MIYIYYFSKAKKWLINFIVSNIFEAYWTSQIRNNWKSLLAFANFENKNYRLLMVRNRSSFTIGKSSILLSKLFTSPTLSTKLLTSPTLSTNLLTFSKLWVTFWLVTFLTSLLFILYTVYYSVKFFDFRRQTFTNPWVLQCFLRS